jgi:hypothetical protein
MPTYDEARFNPPAPVGLVAFHNPHNGWRVNDVPMLLDSGADVTLIPRMVVDQLDARLLPDVSYEVSGFDSSASLASAVRLEMISLNKAFRGNYLVVDQAWGIVGRDILNLLSLLFDGPHLMWDEHRSR